MFSALCTRDQVELGLTSNKVIFDHVVMFCLPRTNCCTAWSLLVCREDGRILSLVVHVLLRKREIFGVKGTF